MTYPHNSQGILFLLLNLIHLALIKMIFFIQIAKFKQNIDNISDIKDLIIKVHCFGILSEKIKQEEEFIKKKKQNNNFLYQRN